jgi:UDP-glucose 4-epimerase
VPVTTVGVTGASGFMGSALLDHLLARDVNVVALTRTISGSIRHDAHITWKQGDLGSYHDCVAFVEGVDVIVHLAHTNTPLTSNRDLPSDAAMNVVPLLTLLQAIRDAGARPHVVYASTGGALYRTDGRKPVSEDAAVEPTTSYGIQKLMGEHYLRLAAAEGWITATVLRIGNPYGVLLPPERSQGFIGVTLAHLLEGTPVRVFGDPANVRDYVHLDDVMRMFERAIYRPDGFAVYNVGSGEGRSVQDVLGLLQAYTGIVPVIVHEPATVDSRRLPSWIVLDVTKARQDLDWRPEIRFEDGLRALCEQAVAAP